MAQDAYSNLRHNLSVARRTLVWAHVVLWLLKALSLSSGILILSTFVVLALGPESSVAALLGFVAVFGIPALLIAAVSVSLAGTPRLETVAVMADRTLPGTKNSLVSALQLGRRAGELAPYYSEAIIGAVVEEGCELSGALELRKLIPMGALRFWTRAFAVCAVSLAAILAFVPGALRPCFSALILTPFQEKTVSGGETSPAARERLAISPQIAEMIISYDYPRYTGMERREVRTVVGDVAAIRGTGVTLRTEFTPEASSASISFDGGTTLELEKQPDGSFWTSFGLVRNGTYSIAARAVGGNEYVSPPYSVRVYEDLGPFIKQVQPAPDVELDESMELPLEVVCADDYGLSALYLYYFRDPRDVRREEIRRFKDKLKESVLTHFWDVESLQLLPGESVSYFLEVLDNDEVSGPKSARTPVMTAHLPTVAELYASMEEEHTQQIVSLEAILEEAQALRDQLGRIAQELRQETPVSWERKKELEGLNETSRDVLQQIEQVGQALEEGVQKLEGYDPANWELAERLQELTELLKEVESPELRSALDRLEAALSKLDKEEILASMQQFSISQEELLRGLDVAIDVLKQIKLDEQLRSLVEKALQLAEKETQVRSELENTTPDFEKAAQEQANIGEALEELQRDLERLTSETQDSELSDMLKEIVGSMKEGDIEEMIARASAMLQLKGSGGLRRLMRDIETRLYQLADNLAGAEQNFASGQLADVTEAVRQVLHELIDLSKAEEELSACTGGEPSQELALRQQTILDGVASVADRLLEIAKQTPFMSHGTSSELGKTLRNMELALRSFENSKNREGLEAATEALQLVNNVLRSLLVVEQNMCSAQGGGGLTQSLNRMRSLSGLQQSINMSTQTLHSGMGQDGRLRRSEEEELMRIAAQQEMVRRGMEEVARAVGERRDILARLDEIIQDMRRTESSMESRQLDQGLLRQQNQILSRLLDAQRSVQRRDYSGKRYSKPGGEFPGRAAPPLLPEELLRQSERLELQTLRERTERYPDSYRELVAQYLRLLSKGAEK